MAHVKTISKANAGKSLKEILKLAKKSYKKVGSTVSKVVKRKTKRRKSRKGKSKRSKSRGKSKRRGRKSRGRKRR